jgi:hypothetical protein
VLNWSGDGRQSSLIGAVPADSFVEVVGVDSVEESCWGVAVCSAWKRAYTPGEKSFFNAPQFRCPLPFVGAQMASLGM